jgi:acyl carrier protein
MSHTYEDVLQHIVGYLRHKLKGTLAIDRDTDFTQDLNVDSLLIFAIVEDLEETYRIVVPLELLYKEKIRTVADLAKEVVRLIDVS